MFVPNQEVLVYFSEEWCRGTVMSCHRGYVMAHIERPSNLGSLSDRAPERPVVCVHADRVRPAEGAA